MKELYMMAGKPHKSELLSCAGMVVQGIVLHLFCLCWSSLLVPLNSSANEPSKIFEAIEVGRLNQILSDFSVNELSTVRTDHGYTPIVFATRIGAEESVRLLIDVGVDLNYRPEHFSNTALQYAMSFNRKSIAALLFDAGAIDREPFRVLAYLDRASDLEQYWQDNERWWSSQDFKSAMGSAIYGRSDASIRALIDKVELGPARRAILLNDVEQVRMLLSDEDSGPALVNEGLDPEGLFSSTLLMLAARLGRHEICELLINMGADLNASNHIAGSSLMIAVRHNDYELARMLLDSGADPDRGDGISSPLILATIDGDAEMVELLLERGADMRFIKKSGGVSAIEYAIDSRSEAVISAYRKAIRTQYPHDTRQLHAQ